MQSDMPRAKRRRTMQNFEGVMNYFTASEWKSFETAAKDVVMHAIIDRSLAMGLRCPSEHTMKWVVSVFMAVTEDSNQVGLTSCREVPRPAAMAAVSWMFTECSGRLPL